MNASRQNSSARALARSCILVLAVLATGMPAAAQDSPPQKAVPHSPANAPAATGDMAQAEVDAVAFTNAERKKQGLRPLKLDAKLASCARDHSRDMLRLGFFSHQSPVKGKAEFFERARKFGTSAGAENIAQNSRGASEVVDGWMNSPGHRRNMMNPSFSRIGIGKAGEYWTMMLGD